MMANFSRGWIVFATMMVAVSLFFLRDQSGIAHAATYSCGTPTSTSTNTSTQIDTESGEFSAPSAGTGCGPTSTPTSTPTTTGADSSGNSINDLAKQRFNQ